MRVKTLSLALFVMILASLARTNVEGFIDNKDGIQILEGMVIIIAGEVEELSCLHNGAYDCSSWPRILLRFKQRDFCFESDYYNCGFSCQGFVAVGKDKTPYFFIIERDLYKLNGDYIIKKFKAKIYDCPGVP